MPVLGVPEILQRERRTYCTREEALRGFRECPSGSKLVHSAALRVTTGLKDLLESLAVL